MKKTFLVIYEQGKKNFGGFAPDVDGCTSLGDTLEDIRLNLREALELYMETAVELGRPLPEPLTTQVTLPLDGETNLKAAYVVEHLTISVPRPRHRRPATTSTTAIKTSKRRATQAS